ncbi:hypothetical protein DEO72_LG4g241 [Vigna unguiculata]|uniref:Uncharacterized protein n=1 Tax=Vigna unguiculata TaxID=3917 RepID=A0A4D6LL33_VIGUN|nr:hypothetical protein DEO72_LG4g241 [Vigna unguiculata]
MLGTILLIVCMSERPASLISRARAVNLAQASRTRLSESGEGSPKPVCTKGRPGDPLKFFSERTTRPSERVHNSLGSLGETFRAALQWSRHNSIAPLGGEQRYPPQVQASAESDQVIQPAVTPLGPSQNALLGCALGLLRANAHQLLLHVSHSSAHAPYFHGTILLIVCMSERPASLISRARAVNLAQASRTRLSESGEGSPKPVCTKGRPGDPLKFFSERTTRPSERGLA